MYNFSPTPIYPGNKCNKCNSLIISTGYVEKTSVTNRQMLHLQSGVNLLKL